MTNSMANHGQATLGHFCNILLSQGTSGGVTGVGKRFLTRFDAIGVDAFELFQRDKDFTTYLEHVGDVLAADFMWNIFDGARISGDVFPHATVSAGGRPDKAAFLIDQID